MSHEEDVAFIMGVIADRATSDLPLAREVRGEVLQSLAEVDEHAPVAPIVATGRAGAFKRYLARVLSPTSVRQRAFNEAAARSLRQLETLSTILEARLTRGWLNLDNRFGELEHEVAELQDSDADLRRVLASRVANLESELAAVRALATRLDERYDEATGDVRRLTSQRAADRAEFLVERSRVAMLLREARSRLPEPFDIEQLRALAETQDHGEDVMYALFEERFRGSRADVRALQKPYLQDVHRVATAGAQVLDLGPGRCEWLELLKDEGIAAYGIDLNEEMVKVGLTYGVDVRVGDAVEHLRKLPEASLSVVTAFHVIEHLERRDVLDLLDAARHALEPGGLLILETPNPTNLTVGASTFYLDPTHLRPMHPQLLEFLVEARGFVDPEVRYLHPTDPPPVRSPGPEGGLEEAVAWALFGPQDYAVVATKPGANSAPPSG